MSRGERGSIGCLLKLLLIPLFIYALTMLVVGGMALLQEGYAPSAGYLKEIGVDRDEYSVLYEADNHGGFHGDGLYFVVLDCEGRHEEMMELTEGWLELPLPKELHRMIYTEGFGCPAMEGLYEIAQDGCYYFRNRHRYALNEQGSDIFGKGKYSCNFDLAVYDRERDTLCMMVYDT